MLFEMRFFFEYVMTHLKSSKPLSPEPPGAVGRLFPASHLTHRNVRNHKQALNITGSVVISELFLCCPPSGYGQMTVKLTHDGLTDS